MCISPISHYDSWKLASPEDQQDRFDDDNDWGDYDDYYYDDDEEKETPEERKSEFDVNWAADIVYGPNRRNQPS